MLHFLKNLLLILVVTIFSYRNTNAQNYKKVIELKNYFWQECSNDFKVTEVPEKWKEKPAVIIARSFEKYYEKRRVGGLEYFDYEHYRIKIQSQKALEDYAEFSFPESNTFAGYDISFYAGYKIIKPDGKEIEVSLNDAVVSEMKVNRYELNMLKLAIPNLEIGDIVDFYIAEEQLIPPVDNYFSFSPSINILVTTYPIMKQKIMFNVERMCYLNAKSLNGAPEFVKQKKGDKDVYVLEDEDRENYEDNNWMYPYRQLPTIKFKAVYAKGAVTTSPFFLGYQGILKNKVSQAEVVAFALAFLNDYRNSGVVFHKKFIKKQFKGRKDKKALAKEIFYKLRKHDMVDNSRAYIQNNQDQNLSYNNYKFVSILAYVYNQFGIKNEFIVGVPRSISNIEDIIIENEIVIGLKVSDEFYIGGLNNYSTFGQYPYSLEGTEVYVFRNNFEVNTEIFQISSADDNNISKEVDLTINDLDNDEITLKIKSTITGHHKEEYQNQLVNFFDCIAGEPSKYNIKEYSNPAKKNKHAKYLQRKAYMDELEQKKLDYLEILAESNYDLEIKEVNDLEITQYGRHHSKPELVFTYNANIEGAVKKIDEAYLISIGKLIDKQLELEKEELERTYDIYMPYARSYDYKLIFNIPKGYLVEGIENLNVNEETEFGGFTCKAELNEDQLVLNARKYYTSNFVEKQNWEIMKTFLNAAEDFNEKSVLLKAIE